MESIEEKFRAYEEKNPHVYEEFKRNTLELAKAGVKKTSAWLVINKMRWDSMLSVESFDYKIPNDFIGVYARRFMKQYPQYDGIFTIKSSKHNLDDLV